MASVGSRRSYNGDRCTVRFVGAVAGTTGEWLGVEWDDPTRGKHSGEHHGVRYFKCKSKHPTAGSFVRPNRPTDTPRGFLEALREKYASDGEEHVGQESGASDALHQPIEISGKVVEEVGFDKIRKQLAELQELKIVLVDGLLVVGALAQEASPEQVDSACQEISQTCPKITELDLSRNLLQRWSDVKRICDSLEKLRVLRLNGNRIGPVAEDLRFEGITELQLDDTLLEWDEISLLSNQFPSLTTLSVSSNQISSTPLSLANSITALNLEYNEISSLSSLRALTSLTKLNRLSLRGNQIDKIYESSTENLQFAASLESVDLSRNKLNSWHFVNQLTTIFPGLKSLRISGNPLYDQAVGPSTVTGMPEKPMTVDEAYMLTLSRVSSLQMLNYGTITPKDRSNAELYYLSLIGKELSAFPESAEQDILAKHPRYDALCQTYGEPVVTRALASTGPAVDPRSVAARLVKLAFYTRQQSVSNGQEMKLKEVPRSFDVYQVKAIASRLFGLEPYSFRLVWETDEFDPVSKKNIDDEDEWDSEDEDTHAPSIEDSGFVKREVELVDSTKDIGFLFQSDTVEARIRVEMISSV
ncbi:tubulin-specific chaperone [Aspergillus avenaceus]|uniref:Tubulin-specific chaperone E n=1 Tax=Aspergillus avenaceus TaxID=36643 RepID=A0A5N6U0R1_ASPAV|nr:tubulin-specific chaperone [Aspergillus avenaceus]